MGGREPEVGEQTPPTGAIDLFKSILQIYCTHPCTSECTDNMNGEKVNMSRRRGDKGRREGQG